MFGKLPSDSFFEEMDPIEKLWLYESWAHDLSEGLEKDRAIAILTGSFSNPEAAHKMYMKDNPDIVVSDDEFNKQVEEQKARIEGEEKPRAKLKKARKTKRTVVK